MDEPTKTLLLKLVAELSDLRTSVVALSGELQKLNPALTRIHAEVVLKNEKAIVDPQYDLLRKEIGAL